MQVMRFSSQSERLYLSASPMSPPHVITNHAHFAPRSSVFSRWERTMRGMRHAYVGVTITTRSPVSSGEVSPALMRPFRSQSGSPSASAMRFAAWRLLPVPL